MHFLKECEFALNALKKNVEALPEYIASEEGL